MCSEDCFIKDIVHSNGKVPRDNLARYSKSDHLYVTNCKRFQMNVNLVSIHYVSDLNHRILRGWVMGGGEKIGKYSNHGIYGNNKSSSCLMHNSRCKHLERVSHITVSYFDLNEHRVKRIVNVRPWKLYTVKLLVLLILNDSSSTNIRQSKKCICICFFYNVKFKIFL